MTRGKKNISVTFKKPKKLTYMMGREETVDGKAKKKSKQEGIVQSHGSCRVIHEQPNLRPLSNSPLM
jgi:hypothetical protein